MNKTYKDLVEKTKQHKNELVLQGWTICVLLEGIYDDGEDYYYRLVEPYRGLVHNSCVGRIEFLKQQLDDATYNRIYDLFKGNYKMWYNKRIDDNLKDAQRIEDEFDEIAKELNV